jgi:hypothetical protein
MKTVIKIALISCLWLTVISSGTLGVIDSELRLQMAHAWWTGTEEVEIPAGAKPRVRGDIRFGVVGADGRRYISYEQGQSLLMLPGDWLGTQLQQWFPEIASQQLRELAVSLLIFIPLNVAVVIAAFWLLRLLEFGERLSGLTALTWLLGTTVLHYAQLHQQNNQVLLCALLGYGGALAYTQRQRPQFAFISGLAAGGAILIRITSAVHALTVFLFLIGCVVYQRRRLQSLVPAIGWWVAGFLPFSLLGRLLDWQRYGSFWANARMVEKIQLTTDSMWEGMPQLPDGFPLLNPPHVGIFSPFFSPAKSIFLYDPLLLPCVILAIFLWRRISPYLQWYIITIAFNLCFHLFAYSRYFFWHGDSAWGARYHVTSVQLLLLPLIALLLQQLLAASGLKKRLMQSLIALTIVIQFASVAMPMDLEIFQAQLGMPGTRHDFRLGQRIVNISCLIRPKWSNRCTENHPDKQQILSTWNHLAFLPFTFNHQAIKNPAAVKYSAFLFAAWLIVLILAIATTLKFVVL